MEEEKTLIQQAQSGDVAAFEQLTPSIRNAFSP